MVKNTMSTGSLLHTQAETDLFSAALTPSLQMSTKQKQI